jgi:hypothetical protein
MLHNLYARWMFAWETSLTTRDTNRIVRPLDFGLDWLPIIPSELPASEPLSPAQQLASLKHRNTEIVAHSSDYFAYTTPTDYRIERRHPALYPTNVRPETLSLNASLNEQARSGELPLADFLRFTSPAPSRYVENDQVNARWYPAHPSTQPAAQHSNSKPGQPPSKRQALIVLPQWNADAFSHNALCTIANRFGISALRLSKPYHDIRRPAELERSDYAVSSNLGRTIAACRQAVTDIRACLDWLQQQGYEQFGAFVAAAHDPRLQVCCFNHASLQFGDVVWTGQSTRHIRAAVEDAGLTQADLRDCLAAVSPLSYMPQFATNSPGRQVCVIHATYDLTFLEEFSQQVLAQFRHYHLPYTARTLPCGHYTTGEFPYKYLDGYYMGRFLHDAFRALP